LVDARRQYYQASARHHTGSSSFHCDLLRCGIHRAECYRCHKAAIVCVCDDVRRARVENRTGIVILQHPRERFHPIGTVRFAKLGLANVRVIVDPHPERVREDAAELDVELPPGTGLLYPSLGGRLLSEVPAGERPEHLLILDGTWPQARSTYRRNRWLRRLPHYHLAPPGGGRYRIRLEPDERSLSTIEAIVGALEILEPSTSGLRGLLDPFEQMIDRQIDFARVPHPRVRRPPRRPLGISMPPSLRDHPERIVLVYGEFIPPEPHTLLYWCALRLIDRAQFAAFVRPAGFSSEVPHDRQLRPMGFSREQIAGGCSIEALRQNFWGSFLREGDVIAAWNQSTLEFFGSEGLSLKAAYCNARKSTCGTLATVLEREGLQEIPVSFAGRSRAMMGQLWPLATWLRTLT
jgi:DTW domain-containing protein